MSTTVTDNADQSRFEVHVDGKLAGFADYRRSGDVLDLTHTVVEEEYAGEGLAGALAEHAFTTAREQGLSVLPHCSYMAKHLAEHTELVDLVPMERRLEFGLPETPR